MYSTCTELDCIELKFKIKIKKFCYFWETDVPQLNTVDGYIYV